MTNTRNLTKKLQEISKKLGPFDYNKYGETNHTSVKREQRNPHKLPNGAIYIGEWYSQLILFIHDIGISIQTKEKERVNRYGQMDLFTKVFGDWIKQMVKAD